MANSQPGFHVLYEDNHLLVVSKPAPLATMGVEGDSLLERARRYIKEKYAKPGNVYLGVVSRLDSFVTGAIVLARTSKAAARLTRQFAAGKVEKLYWARVAGRPPAAGEWTDWLRKDETRHRMETCPPGAAGGKEARLKFRRLEQRGDTALVEVELLTGRKHQIRVQFTSRGHAIVGDRKYDSERPFPAGIALHSCRLSFRHPVRDEQVTVTAELPASWR